MASWVTGLRTFARTRYGAALDAWLAQHAPDAAGADLRRAIDDFASTPGSAGGDRTVLRVYAEDDPQRPTQEVAQVLRWEAERRRGVFVVQRAGRDRLVLWDPLEGAPLTLHLLEKLSTAAAGGLREGSVVTATWQPWMARLVAVHLEVFTDPQALALFRREVLASGTRWHEAPAAAPERGR
jgi:hypothetical protein